MRGLTLIGGAALDFARHSPGDEKAAHDERASLLIPIIKGWLTERSVALTSDALQVHGGMGFIEETGAAQHYRDARILPIYEGTTAIQANDLIFRKTLRDGGAAVRSLLSDIKADLARVMTVWLARCTRRLPPHLIRLISYVQPRMTRAGRRSRLLTG